MRVKTDTIPCGNARENTQSGASKAINGKAALASGNVCVKAIPARYAAKHSHAL